MRVLAHWRFVVIVSRNRYPSGLTQLLISIDRCSRMVNREIVFKGVPKV